MSGSIRPEQVNLIGGKNNVDKTAFIEAIDTNLRSYNIEYFSRALFSIKYRRERRNNHNKELSTYLEMANGLNVSSNIRECAFKVIIKDGTKKYKFTIDDRNHSVNSNDFAFVTSKSKNIWFMSSLGATDKALIKNYSSLQKNDKEGYLNSFLKKIDSRIDSFKIIEDTPQCKVDSAYIELSDMGDGIRHLINIVSSLYSAENGQLFIDEMDNGLHYTLLDDIWEIILTLSKEHNVQVFATTHSKECIESYGRVIKKLNDNEASYILLSKLKDSSIDAAVYNDEMLINTLEQDHEIRGW